MADIVLNHIADHQQAQEHAHPGQHQIGPSAGKNPRQTFLDGMDGNFEEDGGQSAEDAGEDGQAQQHIAFRNVTQKGPHGAPEMFYAAAGGHLFVV